jgi:O-methyltransferase domain
MADASHRNDYTLADIYEFGLALHCICAVVRLGVPDLLAGGSLEVSDLATSTGAREEPLWRVLRFLEDYGVVALIGRKVALADKGHLLRKDHRRSMWPTFAAIGPADAAHALAFTLRTGNAAAEEALGTSFWNYLATHPDEQEIFDAQMSQQARIQILPYIADLEWPTRGIVADIGGGVGTLLAAVLQAEPSLRGVLIEQPQVIARARDFLVELQLTDRCDLRQADLFAVPPHADIYLLAFVLHDWMDEAAARILSAVRQGAAPSSRLRIFERLIVDGVPPRRTKMFDIGMLLLTNGRERTAAEMEDLLGKSGWKVEKTLSNHGSAHMIQARPIP